MGLGTNLKMGTLRGWLRGAVTCIGLYEDYDVFMGFERLMGIR